MSSAENKTLKLFLYSFLGLFFELVFIRWLPDAVHVFAFLGNFVLLACFLGLGVGLAKEVPESVTDESLVKTFLGYATALIVLFCIFQYFRIDVPPPNDGIFLNDDAAIKEAVTGPRLNIYVTATIFISLIAFCFIPLGKLINRYLNQHSPLYGYAVNILASLLGIATLSFLSFLRTPPYVWMLVGLLLMVPLIEEKSRTALVAFAGVLCVFLFGFSSFVQTSHGYTKMWSPYYNLRLFPRSNKDFQVYIGNSCLLTAVDVSPETGNSLFRGFYDFPYRFIEKPERVLILGAGMGNDVMTAVHHGVKEIDAVEIDPVVMELGRTKHPERPYSHPSVNFINDDARSFIRNADKKYDLIIYATLDSHGLFSHMSSIKMENYVYTKECFEEAKALLSDRGVLYLNVGFMGKFVPIKLYRTLESVFGEGPQFFIFKNAFSMFICGNADPNAIGEDKELDLIRASVDDIDVGIDLEKAGVLPTDDWPQMYLNEKKIPMEYIYSLGLLLLISVLTVRFQLVGKGRSFKIDWHFFFLGAGFMLIEAKSITQLGLLFGSTWLVNSVVISGILLMIFLANVYLLKREKPLPLTPSYAALLLTLIGLFFLPLRELGFSSAVARYLVSIALLFLPLLLAALIFGTSFKKVSNPSSSLASNMLGAMVGGALEYSSLAFGLQALYIVAIIIYGLSWFGLRTQTSE